ncbi:MAG TPA: P1 family peptidase, partial [Longimicrobiales bacterium]|nr:P1 family peptidase [Longimicrobiales bacterium]
GGYTVGVLVQCNQGARRDLRIAGVPVGERLGEPAPCHADRTIPAEARYEGVPICADAGGDGLDGPGTGEPLPEAAGSIIIVLATDAPLLPTQVKRLVRRTALGLARIGGMGYNGSGDIFVGFSTANRQAAAERGEVVALEMLPNDRINPLIVASVQATEEAILNAMLAAETMTGVNGFRVPALPHESLRDIMARAAAARTEAR